MKTIIRNHKHGDPSFIGVIGNHLIEILDDNPQINLILSSTSFDNSYFFYSNDKPRYCGRTKRMLLKTFSNDVLIFFHTRVMNQKNHTCELKFFVNNSKINKEELLVDALKLASLRWEELYCNNQTYNLEKLFKPLPQGIVATLSSMKNL